MKKDKFQIFKSIITAVTVILIIASTIIITVISLSKEITVVYLGNKTTFNTLTLTVGDLLKEKNIFVNENMNSSHLQNESLKDNMVITIKLNTEYERLDLVNSINEVKEVATNIIFQEKQIPFEETKVENNLVARGIIKTKEEGINGLTNEIYIVKDTSLLKENYKLKIDEEVVTTPVNKVIEVGTNINLSVNRNNKVVIPSVDNGFKVYNNIKLPADQQQYAYYLAKKYGFEYELFLAMMFKESGFKASAIGGGNSYGLCQIHNSNFTKLKSKLGVTNFLDPYDNMKAGAYMLNMYLNSAKKFSNENKIIEVYALNSYNMGEGRYFDKCYSKGIIDREYSTSIRKMRDSLKINGYL